MSQKSIFSKLLILTDASSAAAAFFAAYLLRNNGLFRSYLDSVQPLSTYLTAIPFAILLLIFTLFALGLYEEKIRDAAFGEFFSIIKGTIVWMLLIMSGSYLYKYDYSRIIMVLFWLFSALFVIASRSFIRRVQKKFTGQNIWMNRVLIVGAGEQAMAISRQLEKYKNTGTFVAGFLSEADGYDSSIKILGRFENIFDIIKAHRINNVYIADRNIPGETILDTISLCPEKSVRFMVATDLFQLAAGRHANLYDIDEIPSLDLKHLSPNTAYLFEKRVLDVFLSLFGLITTLLFWPLISLMIKLDSRGESLITQERVGYKGKKFKMYKFRTMRQDAGFYEPAPRSRDDPRITRVGRFLRMTSLDELPQLLNVLNGEMSIVGPRPEMPFMVEKYKPWQRKRLEVKPGLTGLWQILGRKDLPLNENLEYDFYYINNQSILLDITIILKTIPYVILSKGAY